MASKKINYNKRIQAIRPFVSLPFKSKTKRPRYLTLKQKRRITFLYNEIAALKNRPYKITKPKLKRKLRIAQDYAGQPRIKYLKVAFIPIGKGKVKIRYKGGRIYVDQEHVTSTNIIFDQQKLAKNAKQYVEEIIKGHPGKSFNIMAGRYEIPTGYDRDSIGEGVAYYTSQYGNETIQLQGGKGLKKNNHYFGNWLLGVRAHEFRKQSTFKKYNADKKKAIDASKQARKKRKKKRG